jgi:hypothetical protein
VGSDTDGIFRLVPEHAMAPDQPVVLIDDNGRPTYLIRENTPLPVVVAELDRLATHVVRHGLWIPQPESATPPRLQHAG